VVNQPGHVVAPSAARPGASVVEVETPPAQPPQQQRAGQADEPKKKKGFWGKLSGMFGSGSQDNSNKEEGGDQDSR
jgi:hypothetical protein